MNDDILIKLLKKHPSDGLNKVIEIYAPLVKTVVTRILGMDNRQDIEECISDTFVELWKSIDKFDIKKGKLKNFIISIARHVSIDHYRKKYKDSNLISIEENEIELDFNLDYEVSKNINKEIINETINDLGEPDREIFIRRYFLYESVKSIASDLNINDKLVENKLFRGRKKLKDTLISKGIII